MSDNLLLRAEQVRPFGYLQKPYRQTELEFMIRMALARARVEQELTGKSSLRKWGCARLRRSLSTPTKVSC